MSYPTQQLQPFTLYMTISVPEEPAHTMAHRYDRDTSTLEIMGSKAPDGSGQYVVGSGDFQWGIYWHRELGDGTWYTYRFTPPSMYEGPPGLYKPWTYNQAKIKESPRLNHYVVGLIRILRVPDPIGTEISSYLDWLAPRAATKASRDDSWATAICLRTRQYVAKERKMVDKGVEDFDATGLVCQSMQFAYREV